MNDGQSTITTGIFPFFSEYMWKRMTISQVIKELANLLAWLVDWWYKGVTNSEIEDNFSVWEREEKNHIFLEAGKCLLSDSTENELMPSFGGYWLPGLISTMAHQNEFQIGLAGGEVTLNCPGIIAGSKLTQEKVTWKHYDTLLCYMNTQDNRIWKSKASNSLPLLPLHSWDTCSLLTKPIFFKSTSFRWW